MRIKDLKRDIKDLPDNMLVTVHILTTGKEAELGYTKVVKEAEISRVGGEYKSECISLHGA